MIELLIAFIAGGSVAGGLAVYNVKRWLGCSLRKAGQVVTTGGGGGGGPLDPL